MALLTDQYIKALVFFWMIAAMVTNRERLRTFAWSLTLCSIPLAVMALLHFAKGDFLSTGTSIKRIEGYAGLSGNPNDLALTLNLLIPFTGALLFTTRSLPGRALALFALLLSVPAVIVTFSRAGFLTLAAIALMGAFCLMRRGAVLPAVARAGRGAGDHAGAARRLHRAAQHDRRYRRGSDRIGPGALDRLPGGHRRGDRQSDPGRRSRPGHPGAQRGSRRGRPGDRCTTRFSSMRSISGFPASCCSCRCCSPASARRGGLSGSPSRLRPLRDVSVFAAGVQIALVGVRGRGVSSIRSPTSSISSASPALPWRCKNVCRDRSAGAARRG